MIRWLQEGLQRLEKRRLSVSFSGTIQSCSPRKQTTGPSSDGLPALQRDLFLNVRTREGPIPRFKGRGASGISVGSAVPRPCPRAPPRLTSASPRSLQTQPGPSRSVLPLPPSPPPFPRPRPSAGAAQGGLETANPEAAAVSRGPAPARRGRGPWGRGLVRGGGAGGSRSLGAWTDGLSVRLPLPRPPAPSASPAELVPPRRGAD